MSVTLGSLAPLMIVVLPAPSRLSKPGRTKGCLAATLMVALVAEPISWT